MPHHGRNELRQQAKTIREIGETVWLVTTNSNVSPNLAPLSIVAADAPPLPSQMTLTPIYAFVQWSADDVTYDEVGHAHNISATVTANVQYRAQMQAAFAVKFSDGSILKKTDEKLSDERTSFAIHVQGEANMVNE